MRHCVCVWCLVRTSFKCCPSSRPSTLSGPQRWSSFTMRFRWLGSIWSCWHLSAGSTRSWQHELHPRIGAILRESAARFLDPTSRHGSPERESYTLGRLPACLAHTAGPCSHVGSVNRGVTLGAAQLRAAQHPHPSFALLFCSKGGPSGGPRRSSDNRILSSGGWCGG